MARKNKKEMTAEELVMEHQKIKGRTPRKGFASLLKRKKRKGPTFE